MIQLYSDIDAGREVVVNQNIVFDNKVLQTGCTATANVPTNTVTLNKAGFYMVHFNAVVANNTGASGKVNVIMTNNGVDVDAAQSGATSAGATDLADVGFTTLVRVRPNCCASDNTARLQFKVEGVDALVFFSNVVVTKIA